MCELDYKATSDTDNNPERKEEKRNMFDFKQRSMHRSEEMFVSTGDVYGVSVRPIQRRRYFR